MNLYYAVTNYHLLCCALHANKYHAKENNVLYLSSWHPEHEFILKQLKKIKIFSRVELFEEVAFPSGNKEINSKQIKKDIQTILKQIPNKFIEDVRVSDEINVAGDDYCASVYLVENEITYNYLEEACGVLSDEERLMKNVRNIDYSRYQIMKELKLPGNHQFIKERYGDLNHQLEGYANSKDIHFSVSENLKTLSKQKISEIVQIFSDEKVEVPKNSTLLLTFHYVNMNLLTMETQKYLYDMLVDYFFIGDNLVIKQHPSDVQPNYDEWFSNSIILPRKMPSELLPFLSKNKFLRALTAYSTSIFSLKSYCNDVVSFGSSIEKNFKLINRYYFLLQILSRYVKRKYQIVGVGLDEFIVKNIINQYGFDNLNICLVENVSDIEYKDKQIIILDEFEIDKLNLDIFSKERIVFLLNSDKMLEISKYCRSAVLSDFANILLMKEKLDDTKLINNEILKPEVICYYCADNEFKNYLLGINIQKELKHCNVVIRSNSQNTNDILYLKDELAKLYDKLTVLEQTLKKEKEQAFLKNKQLTTYNNELKKLSEIQICELTKQYEYYKELYDGVINSSSWKLTSIYRKVGGILKQIVIKIKK